MSRLKPRTRTNVFVRAVGALLLLTALLGLEGSTVSGLRSASEVGPRHAQATVHDSLATFARAPAPTVLTRAAVFATPIASVALVIVTLCVLFHATSGAHRTPRALRRYRLRGPPPAR